MSESNLRKKNTTTLDDIYSITTAEWDILFFSCLNGDLAEYNYYLFMRPLINEYVGCFELWAVTN